MAKKKHTHEKPSQKQEDPVKAGGEIAPSMDSEALEKLESLKSLNQMLLKEAFERRQQVESLVQARGYLESQVARSNSEKEALSSELTRVGERAASLELERSVVDVFVAVQVGMKGDEFEQKIKGLEMEKQEMKLGISEKESDIGRLNCKVSEIEDELANEREVSRRFCVERDDFGEKLRREIEEGKGLKEKLIKFGEIKREIDELRGSYNAAVGEKADMEMRMKSQMGEKDSMERGLVEANTLIQRLKEQLCGIVKEKEGIDEEKKLEAIKNHELENALSGANEIVADLQKEETKLRATVAEFEKKFAEGEGRQKEMVRAIDELVEEKKLSKERIQCLIDEKSSIEKGSSELARKLAEFEKKLAEGEGWQKEMGREIDELVEEKKLNKERIQCLIDEKSSIEKGSSELVRKLAEFEKKCAEGEGRQKEMGRAINELVEEKKLNKERIQCLINERSSIEKESSELVRKVAEFEKKCAEGEGRQKEMGREIYALVEEKKLNKERIQCLIHEKSSIEKESSELVKKLAEQKDKIQELVDEKSAIMEAKGVVDNVVGDLQNEVAELKAVILKLEEGNHFGLEKIKRLESEVGEYNSKLEKANVERGEMERRLNAEKENVSRLKEKIAELESKSEESYKIIEQAKTEKGEIFDDKMEVESRCEKLKMEVASLQKAINEGRNELKSMKDKVELANAKSELVLKMVKGTAVFCSKDECEDEDDAFVGEETKEYAMELEKIKKALKTNVGKVKEMKKEFELLEEDAKKKKSFWTMVSSATTLLAAVSVAYVARVGGH